MQTGTGGFLNAFSWASLAPGIVGAAAVDDTTGTLCDRNRGPRQPCKYGNRGNGCQTDSVGLSCGQGDSVTWRGGGCTRPPMSQWCGLALVPYPYLVVGCVSVPKVGTVLLQDLHNPQLGAVLAEIWYGRSHLG